MNERYSEVGSEGTGFYNLYCFNKHCLYSVYENKVLQKNYDAVNISKKHQCAFCDSTLISLIDLEVSLLATPATSDKIVLIPTSQL
jgi:hypothetical protein